MTYSLDDRILGGLYGQAAGDAIGMPAYFDPGMTTAAYGWIDRMHPAPDDHEVHAGLPVARITDDSEQAFSLATAFLAAGAVSTQAAAEAIIAWYDRTGGDQSLYVGPSTRRGVQALKAGTPPEEAGRRGDTNGAAMRVSVVGLFYAGDVMGAIDAAHRSAVPTHNTNVAISGACAVAAAVAFAARPDSTIDGVIAAGLLGAEMGRARGTRWLGPSTARKIEQAVAIARNTPDARTAARRLYDEVGTSLATQETVGAAFGCFAHARGDVRETALLAANTSGDADTVAAIATAIAGAFCGIAAVPAEWAAALDADPVFQQYDVHGLARGIGAFTAAGRG
jgi:ADP-ribosylglycohydrolase